MNLRELETTRIYRAGTITIGLIGILWVSHSVGMRTLSAQSTTGLSSGPAAASSRPPVAESDTLVHDILEGRVALNAESSPPGSTLAQHDQRPFRRKPRKNVLVDVSLRVPIAALFVVVALLVAWMKRRHRLHRHALGLATASDRSKGQQLNFPLTDAQCDTASQEAREELCQPK
jgi:hypothetical protein